MKIEARKSVICAMFAAMICVLTMFPQVPTGIGGYIHIGDGMILVAGAMLGPIAALPSAIGSMLADIFSGYAAYAPATFVIKLCVGFLAGHLWNSQSKIGGKVISLAIAELAMVAGYFIYEIFLTGFYSALLSSAQNMVQWAFSITLAVLLLRYVLKKLV